MVKTRALKVQNIANELPPTDVFGDKSGDLLILSWGGTPVSYTHLTLPTKA